MSLPLIRRALEEAVAALEPPLATIWRNAPGDPPSGEPYQLVDLLMAAPGNDEYGAGAVQQGALQVTLAYPLGAGAADSDERAQAIVDAFHRGCSLPTGDLVVTVTRTPHVMPSYRDGDRFMTPVRITFHCHVPAPAA